MPQLSSIIFSLNAKYPNINRWIQQSNKSELIVDIPQVGCIFFNGNSMQGFFVDNPNSKLFCLIQIDNKLLPAQLGGQCDCAITYDENINFIEFKTGTTTINKNTIKRNYAKAEKQLKNTIQRLAANGINLFSLAANVEAHICFNNTFPRNKASEMARSIRFANQTNGIGLFFDDSKTI